MKKFLFVLLLFCVPTICQAKQPNIILIMADDLGYECIGANGCEDYKTPNLDKLAKTGMRFTNCFANPLCTPSRVKIMTGLYNVRNYIQFGKLDRSQETSGNIMKAAGYKTCVAGKWQLGREKDSPQHFGFEQSCLWQQMLPRNRKGTKYDSRFSNPVLEINGEAKTYSNGEFGPDICAEFVCNFIDKNKDKPFFVYYPMILTHCPFIPTPGTPDYDPKSLGSPTYKGTPKYFVDMDQHLDKIIGRIVAKLDELKLREDTIILFTGDNGTDQPIVTRMNGQDVVGGKGQMNDNGTRVPLIVNWPGKVKVGTSDELVDFSDVLPTLCEIAGTKPSRTLDGVSFWSTLQGKSGRDKPWAYIWYSRQGGDNAASVIARNKTHLVLQTKGKYQYLHCDTPYDLQKADASEPAFKKLQKVIETLGKERRSALPKGGKK